MKKSKQTSSTSKKQTVPLIEHIGWDLWRATEVWKNQFYSEMVARGYVFFAEARGQLLRHIPATGVSQSEVVANANMTKQAVQQQLDLLEEEGVIERIADPNDARKKLIQYTNLGLEALKEGNAVKQLITARYKKLLGKEKMQLLVESLEIIIKTAKE